MLVRLGNCVVEIVLGQYCGIFWFFEELWYGVLHELLGFRSTRTRWTNAYARHQLEDRGLRIPEQADNLLQALQQGVVVTNGSSHTSGQAVAQIVIDVQLARRPWCQESIVKTYRTLVSKGLECRKLLTICSCEGLSDCI